MATMLAKEGIKQAALNGALMNAINSSIIGLAALISNAFIKIPSSE
jgi:hypothetical protein